MKKLNAKGFTLIELLAVITIMGILMMVAIPTVSRTIENSRKDTFIDTMKSYINGAKNMWAADNLKCKAATGTGDFLSSAVPTGTYYINVDSSDIDSHPVLLEQGGKSSWGSREIKGYIKVVVEDKTLGSSEITRAITYYPVLTDGIHGVNITPGTTSTEAAAAALTAGEKLDRGKIKMSGAGYPALKADGSAGLCWEV